MATFSRIAGQEPSTISFKARTIQHTQNSTAMQQEIVTLGDPENANSVARCSSVAPKSTDVGLIVRLAGGPSSAADVLIQTQGNSTVFQGTSPWVVSVNSRVNIGATAADNAVTISGNSTAIIQGNSTVIQGTSPWIIGGNSTVIQGTSPWVVIGSVATTGDSTVFITDPKASSAPSSASTGVIVRQVVDNILTTASTNAIGTSTAFTIQSSAASLRTYVTAYSITSTIQAPTVLKFMSGSTLIAPVVLAALSSAVIGVNLAVSAPAYLFRTKTAGGLSMNTNGSSLAGVRVWVSYFRAS